MRRVASLSISILFAVGICISASAKASKPNINRLMSDDHCVSSIGRYGNPKVVTPNIDKLGKDGVIFDRYYNTTAICKVNRDSVFTEMYEYKRGTNFSRGNMSSGRNF